MIDGGLDRRPLLALILAVVAGLSIGASVAPSAARPRSMASAVPSVRQLEGSRARRAGRGRAEHDPGVLTLAAAPSPSTALSSEAHDGDSDDYYAYLPLVSTPEAEARALWVTRWDYDDAADVQGLVENAAEAGFNMVLFQVRGTADAYYDSTIEPWAARLSGTLGQDPGWDPLKVAVNAAHANGMELHAYINVYPVWTRSEEEEYPADMAPPRDTSPKHLFWRLSEKYDPWNVWRITDSSGIPMSLVGTGYLWPTPALDDVEKQVVDVADDLVSRYDVDGIHLDLVRYPGPEYSYDPFTEKDETGNPIADWQRGRVTQLVSRVYADAILPRPDVWLSAAVWPVYVDRWDWGTSEGYSDLYQDSQGWVQSGVIDAILPMIYPANVFAGSNPFPTDRFQLLTSDFLDNSGGRHVLPGISAQYDSFPEIAERIAIARREGAPGHAIFSARLVTGQYPCENRFPCHDPYWDDFASGPYADPAVVPSLSWR